MRTSLILLVVALPLGLHARPKPPPQSKGAAWSATQATGAPDVPHGGDHANAWAPLNADAGVEWLELTYEKAVKVAKVRVRATYNPGAITRVTAFSDKTETTLWEGTDRTRKAPGFLEVKPTRSVRSDRIRIYLDTSKVPGWNEVDAVELVGADGRGQWARGATASSSYGASAAFANPLSDLVGKDVTIRMTHTWVAAGRVVSVHAEWIRIEVQGSQRLINRAHIVDIEFR